MHKYTRWPIFGFLFLVGSVAFWGIPSGALADESTSYKLYHEAPNYAERGPAASSSFKMNEDGVTWTAAPLVGTSFQIVTAPPAVAEEPPPGEEEEEEEAPEGGGRRDAEELYKRYPKRGPMKPAAPEEEIPPEKEEPWKLPDEIKFLPEDVTVPPLDAVRYPRYEKRLPVPPHYFRVIDEIKRMGCPEPYAHLVPILWIIAFLIVTDIFVRIRKKDSSKRKRK